MPRDTPIRPSRTDRTDPRLSPVSRVRASDVLYARCEHLSDLSAAPAPPQPFAIRAEIYWSRWIRACRVQFRRCDRSDTAAVTKLAVKATLWSPWGRKSTCIGLLADRALGALGCGRRLFPRGGREHEDWR